MKKKLIAIALLLILAVIGTAGCNEIPEPVIKSSTVSKQESSAVSSQPQPSAPSQSSREVSLPQPGENLPDIPLKTVDFEKLVTRWAELKLTIIDSVPTIEPLAENDSFNASVLTLTVNAEWEGLTAFLKAIIQQEKNDLFLDRFVIERSYYDSFNCTVTLVNPTLTEEADLTENEAQRFVKSRFRALDRQKLLDAFLGLHANYNTQQASCQFTVDSQRRAAVDAVVSFASYKGFVSYRYKINSSEDFTVNSEVSYEQASDDTEYPFHVTLTLYSDHFTV